MAGFVGQPMTRVDVERKRWPAERTDAILRKFWALDGTNDVRLGGLSLQA
jgi:hypothetical protein